MSGDSFSFELVPSTRDQLLSAFGQGEACARRDGYRADNPFMPESQAEQYQAWLAGFEHEEGPRYIIGSNRRDNH